MSSRAMRMSRRVVSSNLALASITPRTSASTEAATVRLADEL